MAPRNSSIRALANQDDTGASSVRELGSKVVETDGDRRARVRAAFELARQEAMADPSMRAILSALAK
jgi:hypothetical protein